MAVGFITPLNAVRDLQQPWGHILLSCKGWGRGGGTQPGQAPSRLCHHGPCMSPRPGHFPHLIFKKAFASNVLEQIELEPNKAVVICKLEMLQRAQD